MVKVACYHLILGAAWLAGFISHSAGQKLLWLDSSHRAASYRGLSVLNDAVVWVSGSGGVIGRTTDGGSNWQWVNPPGYAHRDFRGIYAFSSTEAVVMAVDSPGIILRTRNGGASWKVVYENHAAGIFLDALHFSDRRHGLCAGDPLDGKLFLLYTHNGGRRWHELSDYLRPSMESGEALFAASNTNIVPWLYGKRAHRYAIASGGAQSRLWLVAGNPRGAAPQWHYLPVQQGGATTGANGLALRYDILVAVGGNFAAPARKDSTLAIAQMPGWQWSMPTLGPTGYKSCVIITHDSTLMACGTTGIAYWQKMSDGTWGDGGGWHTLRSEPFHVMQQARNGKHIFLAGPRGRIARLEWP